MPRYSFGGDITHLVTRADTTLGGALKVAPGAAVGFHLERTGGVPVTDYLIDVDGTGNYSLAATAVTARSTGYLPNFQGPDGVTVLYYDPDPNDDDVQRVRLEAWDVAHATIPAASETAAGLARRATQAEVNAGSSDVPFVTPLKLAATALFLKAKGAAVSLAGVSETAATYTVADDGTTQTSWPNRLAFMFGSVLTGHFDRYGQVRANAAKASTAALRVENRNATPSANLIEAGVGATDVLFSVSPTGKVTAPNVGEKVVVLGAADPVPVGTPDKSLIVRLVTSSTGGGGGGGGGSTTTLLKDHLHEGTLGQTASASGEGYTSSAGALPVYVSPAAVGSTALQWNGTGGAANFLDTFPAQDVDLHIRFYFRLDAYAATGRMVAFPPGVQELRVRASDIALWDGVSLATIPKPAVGAWVRYEVQVGTASTTVKVWSTNPASTGAPDVTVTGAPATPIARPTSFHIGAAGGNTYSFDATALGTSAIGPASL